MLLIMTVLWNSVGLLHPKKRQLVILNLKHSLECFMLLAFEHHCRTEFLITFFFQKLSSISFCHCHFVALPITIWWRERKNKPWNASAIKRWQSIERKWSNAQKKCEHRNSKTSAPIVDVIPYGLLVTGYIMHCKLKAEMHIENLLLALGHTLGANEIIWQVSLWVDFPCSIFTFASLFRSFCFSSFFFVR